MKKNQIYSFILIFLPFLNFMPLQAAEEENSDTSKKKELSYYEPQEDQLPQIIDTIKVFPALEEIVITDISFTNEAIRELLFKALAEQPALKMIYFEKNQIGDEGIFDFVNFFQNHQSLKHLFLLDNQIGCQGAAALARLSSPLEVVCLNQNAISNDGIKQWADRLLEDKFLKELSLENNNIQTEGSIYLSSSLKKNQTLIYLSLRENHIKEEGFQILFEALRTNTTLSEIHLHKNPFRIKAKNLSYEAYVNLLTHNSSLMQIGLDSVQLGDASKEEQDEEQENQGNQP